MMRLIRRLVHWLAFASPGAVVLALAFAFLLGWFAADVILGARGASRHAQDLAVPPCYGVTDCREIMRAAWGARS